MAFTPEQKQRALDLYFDSKITITKVISKLGYPTESCLWLWVKGDPRYSYTPPHSGVKYSYELRAEAVRLMTEEKLSGSEVTLRLGIDNPTSVYLWKSLYETGGTAAIMPKKKPPKRPADIESDIPELPDDVEELKVRNYQLELENDVLKTTIGILKKDPGLGGGNLTNKEKVRAINELRPKYQLKELCAALLLSKSSYCYVNHVLKQEDPHGALRCKVASIFEGSKNAYGYRRIWLALQRDDIFVSEKVVRRIMKQEELTVKIKRRRKYSSYKGTVGTIAENILNRNFSADTPNLKWVTDLTEFHVDDYKVYLSPVLDLYNGEIVSWTRSRHPDMKLVMEMLEGAIGSLKEGERPLVHSDMGHHYQRSVYTSKLEEHGLVQSMSKKGCSPDNSVCEGFFGHLKNEFFYNHDYSGMSPEEFMKELDKWIDWYNTRRIKMVLGGLSPVEYRLSQEAAKAV